MSAEPLADEEVLIRHIPGGSTWQAPPDDRISSVNFRPRAGEAGLSVSRLSITSRHQLMARLGNPAAGSKIAECSVAELRRIGLEVVADPIEGDAGHALILSDKASLDQKSVQRQLARAFRYEHVVPTQEV